VITSGSSHLRPIYAHQLTTIKDRLAIAPATTTYDTLLTSAIEAVSARFDSICNRTLARTVGATQEFPGDKTELILSCFPWKLSPNSNSNPPKRRLG